MALLAQNALRMELNTLDRERLVAQPHDLVKRAIGMLAPGGDVEAVGQRVALHHQGVVTGHPQRVVEPLEHPLIAMADERGFAVHYLTGTHYAGAEGLRQRLMTETDAENGQLASEVADGIERDPRLIGRTGTGRDHQKTGGELRYGIKRQFIIALDHNLLSQGAEILHQVPGKRVVVIDQQQHEITNSGELTIEITTLFHFPFTLTLGQIDGGSNGRGFMVLVDGIGDHQLQGIEVFRLAKFT